MLHASLRRSGGSYIMTVPLSYVEQNRLNAGSRLALEIIGDELKIRPERARKSLADLFLPDFLWPAGGPGARQRRSAVNAVAFGTKKLRPVGCGGRRDDEEARSGERDNPHREPSHGG